MQSVFILLFVVGHVAALYSPSDDVIDLNANNFDSKVIQSDDLWLVEFYAPWCGHCKSLAPEWKKAATALKGIVKVGAVDADQHQSLGGRYGVRGFPTIKVFGVNKNLPTDYNGQRSAASIVDTAINQAKQIAMARLSGGGGSSGGSGGSRSQKTADPQDVVELTDSNFDSMVLDSTDLWLVEFFAPWCGHCKNLAPHWAEAATELKGRVKLGALDATVHTVAAGKFNVRGYPTIKFFPGGKKDMSSAEDYDGGRTANDIVKWAEEKLAESAEPPEVIELTNQESLDACLEKQLCHIAFLPDILDTGASGRNDYLAVLADMAEKYKKRQFAYLWSAAGAQQKLEEAVEVGGFGYPAMVSINSRKMKYATLRGAFSADGVNEYLRDLVYGRGSTAPVRGGELPKVSTVEPWDGKDGELPVEDDIDLSDVELDDIETDTKKEEL
ncbi:protein disulfide-isomerase A6 homolog [Corticium candelabrum]|uniref:protein disulfide-isomerase A6 homolog n=1 Tax=Corticium candelabrum TaxID=121492 RepID=UPI002E263D1D|nr:protein disulfide-isomerase A6 homolog [Corticium candelabrum]